MKYNATGKRLTSIEKQLADGVTHSSSIIFRHKRVAPADDGILDLAESILKPLAAPIVDVAASEDYMVAALCARIDAKSQSNKSRIVS